jgi:hypothetical protein
MDQTRQDLVGELARAIGLVASGRAEEAHDIIRTLAKTVDVQRPLPGFAPAEVKVSVDAARKLTAMELLRYWQRECDHPTAKPTPERITAVMARLRDGYSAAEVRKAIDGAKHGAYIDKESGKKFDDLALICRNGSKLEDFIQRGERVTGAIVVEEVSTGGLEEQISVLRRTMAGLRKDGRTTEYNAHACDLQALMAKREAPANLRGAQ